MPLPHDAQGLFIVPYILSPYTVSSKIMTTPDLIYDHISGNLEQETEQDSEKSREPLAEDIYETIYSYEDPSEYVIVSRPIPFGEDNLVSCDPLITAGRDKTHNCSKKARAPSTREDAAVALKGVVNDGFVTAGGAVWLSVKAAIRAVSDRIQPSTSVRVIKSYDWASNNSDCGQVRLVLPGPIIVLGDPICLGIPNEGECMRPEILGASRVSENGVIVPSTLKVSAPPTTPPPIGHSQISTPQRILSSFLIRTVTLAGMIWVKGTKENTVRVGKLIKATGQHIVGIERKYQVTEMISDSFEWMLRPFRTRYLQGSGDEVAIELTR
jgi:hypothetical protein